ncbi:MAG: hypothetical protein QXQ94_05440 [Candidatus Bathyarchaeia archaeon]
MTYQQPKILSKPPEYAVAKTVGLISDTHIPVRARTIPKRYSKFLRKWIL